jgi:hypothetical protein
MTPLAVRDREAVDDDHEDGVEIELVARDDQQGHQDHDLEDRVEDELQEVLDLVVDLVLER